MIQPASSAAARRWLKVAEGLLSCPTAPLQEHEPARWVRAFVRRRPRLALSEDRYGNLLVKAPARSRPRTPPLVLVAHLDHPGFIVEKVTGARARLRFLGGVRLAHARPGTRLEVFRPGSPHPCARAVLESVSARGARRAGMLGSGTARVTSGSVRAGDFTMWAFPGYLLRRGWIVSRCLDDLLGAAAVLSVLDELHRKRPRGAHVWGLFTRAEEVGFYGTLTGIRSRAVPKGARVLSLEACRALPGAEPGDGVIVRVGDARSVFDPPLTALLGDLAQELREEDPDFRFIRRLMDGGACEATAFCAAGYRAGGLAVPLRNYHNMKGLDGGEKGIGPESVRAEDYLREIRLLLRLAALGSTLQAREKGTGDWLRPLTSRATEALGDAPLDGTPGRAT